MTKPSASVYLSLTVSSSPDRCNPIHAYFSLEPLKATAHSAHYIQNRKKQLDTCTLLLFSNFTLLLDFFILPYLGINHSNEGSSNPHSKNKNNLPILMDYDRHKDWYKEHGKPINISLPCLLTAVLCVRNQHAGSGKIYVDVRGNKPLSW